MNRDRLRQWLTVLLVLITIVINGLANALPFNNLTTGEISDRFQVYFVPAGYVFSIWGLIYLGLIAFAVFQALPAQRENPRLRAIFPWFVLASLANITWLFFWHYEQFVLTLPAMLTLLISLIVIYLRLGIGRSTVSAAERWVTHAPFSLYLGWISVATIANVTDVLYYLGWNGGGLAPEVWAVIMLGVVVALAALMAWARRDVIYLLVFVWALAGIAVKQSATPLVADAAAAGAGAVGVLAVFSLVRSRRGTVKTALSG
ncbi:MAG: tryptophan-rich sensory protein [Thermanaerothrix sp.]|uniref:tryptophan-rich sensory protein n=1 Tax=Thermanaerothrix sp. TaxID=2972675 RepID=UPI003C7E0226